MSGIEPDQSPERIRYLCTLEAKGLSHLEYTAVATEQTLVLTPEVS
jgi:hypothetical protein